MDYSSSIDALNDLIEINNDRITGYQRAIDGLEGTNSHLVSVYSRMAEQSQQLKDELVSEVTKLGGNYEEGNTILGSIHHAWMDIKNAFRTENAESTLESSLFGEDAAQTAYAAALELRDLNPQAHAIISRQKSELMAAHEEIKALKHSVEAAD